MFKNFWRQLITNFSYFFLFCGVGYFLLPHFGYRIKFLSLLENIADWVDILACVLIVIGVIGVIYIYKTDKDDEEEKTEKS